MIEGLVQSQDHPSEHQWTLDCTAYKKNGVLDVSIQIIGQNPEMHLVVGLMIEFLPQNLNMEDKWESNSS